MPLSQNYPPETRENLVARINGLFGGKIAPESFVLSQAYLFGHVDNPDHRVEVVDGDFLDLRDDLYAGSIFKDGSRVGDQAANGGSNGGGQQRRHKSRTDETPGRSISTRSKPRSSHRQRCPYETWLHVGAALYHELGEYGFEIWNAWSAKVTAKYQRRTNAKRSGATFAHLTDIPRERSSISLIRPTPAGAIDTCSTV